MSDRLPAEELRAMLGDEAFIALAETFGGRRLYVPSIIDEDHLIAQTIGTAPAKRLSSRLSPDTIRVPLAREFRARHYRAAGCSNGEIASKLCITETGVEKLFRRMNSPPAKGGASDAQHSLFPDDLLSR